MVAGGGSRIIRKKEAKDELKRIENDQMLNIQLLVIRLLSHSPSSP
jgi:hypothetical protein